MLSIRLHKPTVLQSVRKITKVSLMPDWLCWTVPEAAEATGYSQQYIRRLLRNSKIKIEAVKLGSLYLIRQDSLKSYLQQVEQETDGRFGPKRRK
jgi:excisionase family DNA binding protein